MKKFLLALALVMFSFPALSDDKTVYLTSLDWPPYSGKDLPNQGASIAVAKAAFEAMGYKLVVDFFPWSRTVALATDKDSKYAGYFPEYYSDEIAETFHFSDVMGNGPLGFAQRKDKPIEWETLDDLHGQRIGVVQDYVNTAEFDARVADGRIKGEPVTSDTINLLKLANGRIDLVVIDTNVMNYLLKTEARLKPLADKLEFNPRMMEDKKLYVCFKKTPENEKLLKIFNEGLTKIDVQAIMSKEMAM